MWKLWMHIYGLWSFVYSINFQMRQIPSSCKTFLWKSQLVGWSRFLKKKPTFFLVLNLVTTGKQIEKNFCLLKKYFKTLKDMIIDTANFFESFTFFQAGWNNVEIWKFDATSRAYSRPISRSTIERCPLLRKLYKALFRCKKTKFLVPFFQKSAPCGQYRTLP